MALTVAFLLVIALSFPFLAISATSGARHAVVEGWIPEELMPAVKGVLDDRHYEHIYITGTPRNCSHTFRLYDTLDIELSEPAKGSLLVNACGAPGAGFKLLADTTLVMERGVDGTCVDRHTVLREPASRVRITPTFNGEAGADWELLFTLFVKLDGVNVNAIQRSVSMRTAEGHVESGLPTYADVAARALMKAGVPRSRITTLPSYVNAESRTVSNARRFAQQARQEGITHVDVISLGVHARRSRLAYQEACGKGVTVGVISVDDPELKRGRWWFNLAGWYKVTKELIGLPAIYLIDVSK